jgi:predicted nucleotidyltransferase
MMQMPFWSQIVVAAPGDSLNRSSRMALERASDRRHLAISCARDACASLLKMGVTARVIGSLATGHLGPHSDIDFVVLDCPRHLKYRIEGVVEDCLAGLSFDVMYLDELPAHKLDRFTRDAVDAGHLR